MTDDILTRLREAAQVDEYYAITVHRPMLIAIADEIERLRAEVAYLKTPCPRCDYEEPNE